MISVVLATYNEEKNLKRCLDSVKSFADEIIVVDGSSTDKTRELAKELGAKVIKTTNKPNFHINKQMAMDEAKGELVLQMDADEVIDDELAAFIKKTHQEVLKLKKDKVNCEAREGALGQKNLELKIKNLEYPAAWWLKRKNLFLNTWLKKGGQYPDPVIRLYVNGFARLPQKDVHEQMQVDGDTAWADGHLLHYSNPEFKDYLRKFQAYTSLKASQLYEQKVKINLINSINHLIVKPTVTFLSLFIRHKGFVDGIAGFVFALFSGLHHSVAYLKLWELYERK